MTIRTYSELITLPTFEERFEYLRLDGQVGIETFGFDRWLNQVFYKRSDWLSIRDKVIVRDLGLDLGIEGRKIWGRIIVHHMNTITKQDILDRSPLALDPEYLIATSDLTHKAIHYGDKNLLISDPIIRRPNDTCPWRK